MAAPANLKVYLDEVVDWLSNRKKDLKAPPLLNPKEHHPNQFVTLEDLGAEEMIENRLLIPDSMIEFLFQTTVYVTNGVTANLLDTNSKTPSPLLLQSESNVYDIETPKTNSDGTQPDNLHLKMTCLTKQDTFLQDASAFQRQHSSKDNDQASLESRVQETDSYPRKCPLKSHVALESMTTSEDFKTSPAASQPMVLPIYTEQHNQTTRISTTPFTRLSVMQNNKHAAMKQMVPETGYNAGQLHVTDGDVIQLSNSSSALQQMKLSRRRNRTQKMEKSIAYNDNQLPITNNHDLSLTINSNQPCSSSTKYYQKRTIQKPIKPCNMNGGVLQIKLSPESIVNQSNLRQPLPSNVTPHAICSPPGNSNPARRYMQPVISSHQRVSPYPAANHIQDMRYHSRDNFKQRMPPAVVGCPAVYDHQVSSPANVTPGANNANQMVYWPRGENMCSGPNRMHEQLVDDNYLGHLTTSAPKKGYYCTPNLRYPHGLSGSIDSTRCDQLGEVQPAPSYAVPQYPDNYLQNPPRQQHMY